MCVCVRVEFCVISPGGGARILFLFGRVKGIFSVYTEKMKMKSSKNFPLCVLGKIDKFVPKIVCIVRERKNIPQNYFVVLTAGLIKNELLINSIGFLLPKFRCKILENIFEIPNVFINGVFCHMNNFL
jgi:hypothetical protein